MEVQLQIHIVNVESYPAGALFSVDGRVNSGCNKTPCNIALLAGKHQFVFNKDMYQDKEISVDVHKSGQAISAKLVPYFGWEIERSRGQDRRQKSG